ncbi:MAG: CaiB/BaiF CoA transferase family protein [Acidimicrobiales bacterium]
MPDHWQVDVDDGLPTGSPGTAPPLLAGLRVLEVALLAPDALGMHLADLGADVVKVEEPGLGDYVRSTGFLRVDGVSALHRRWNRGKRSLALDLRSPDGVAVFRELSVDADVVIEGLRAGSLARRGVGYDDLRAVNPRLVFACLSGFGQTGPYRDLASHGVGYDAYAGFAPPMPGPLDYPSIPPHAAVGIHAAALYGAYGVVAAVMRARATGLGALLDIAEADAAAWWNGPAIEQDQALEDGVAEPPRAGGLTASVRYQYYRAADGKYVLFMASERKFWQRFCEAVGRSDLFERWPGVAGVGEHDAGNLDLRTELTALFATRPQHQWIELFLSANVPGTPVYVGGEVRTDPHFRARARWLDREVHGMSLVASPLRLPGGGLGNPGAAPVLGEHTVAVLRDAGFGAGRIEQLLAAGVAVAATGTGPATVDGEARPR